MSMADDYWATSNTCILLVSKQQYVIIYKIHLWLWCNAIARNIRRVPFPIYFAFEYWSICLHVKPFLMILPGYRCLFVVCQAVVFSEEKTACRGLLSTIIRLWNVGCIVLPNRWWMLSGFISAVCTKPGILMASWLLRWMVTERVRLNLTFNLYHLHVTLFFKGQRDVPQRKDRTK